MFLFIAVFVVIFFVFLFPPSRARPRRRILFDICHIPRSVDSQPVPYMTSYVLCPIACPQPPSQRFSSPECLPIHAKTSLSSLFPSRRHQTCYFRKRATSVAAEFAGEIHNVSRNRARTQVLPQAQKLRAYGSGTFGAFWPRIDKDEPQCFHPSRARNGAATPRDDDRLLQSGREDPQRSA